MKIVILTLPFNNNYGGLLQFFALQNYLKQRGHEVYLIQQNLSNEKNKVKYLFKKIFKIGIFHNAKNLELFQNKYFKETLPIKSQNDLSKLSDMQFDAFIVGSDQVWRFKYIDEKFSSYFLDFIKNENVKKIAFAASFGVDTWEANDYQTLIAKELIQSFNGVSVREDSAIQLCRKELNYKMATQLLDPTLLIAPSEYRTLYSGNEIGRTGKIGIYILDIEPANKNFINKLVKLLNKKSFIIGKLKKEYKHGVEYIYPSIQQWLKDFDSADYIITDSFHGMVFSILFNKPFCIIANKNRGLARFNSMANYFELNDKIIDTQKISFNFCDLIKEIDVQFTEKKIRSNTIKTDQFLSEMGL